jgi:small subunit ribosomal protein S21
MAGTPRSDGRRRDTREEHDMIEIVLGEADRLDWALKTFRKKVQKAGVLRELRQRRHYLKPSVAKRVKADAARRRVRKRAGGGG